MWCQMSEMSHTISNDETSVSFFLFLKHQETIKCKGFCLKGYSFSFDSYKVLAPETPSINVKVWDIKNYTWF